ncbi:aldo/keto reductase [Acidipropionibacterium jensenii]|uniref:aldo/keto reductase n=1 Tax=Acidipropionibacterium jensenii TaxID=1749 RepID=UPI00214D1223|nr:aldo/keto reductase [Acidipropionibacterium jensenii]
MRTVTMSDQELPAIGQGTWYLGEGRAPRDQEIAALRAGVDAGMTLVDTAEMYGDGAAEQLVAEALGSVRDELFIVDKVLPSHASREGIIGACQGSLERLGTDHIDLYLLHWRVSQVRFDEVIEGMDDLMREGSVGSWGVSNLDTADISELLGETGGPGCATDQVLYNLIRRGPELELFPLLAEHGIPVMAYSPIEQARLLQPGPGLDALERVAQGHGVSPAQVALAWTVRSGDVLAIPRTGSAEHAAANAAAGDLVLGEQDLAELEAAFPAPETPIALETL